MPTVYQLSKTFLAVTVQPPDELVYVAEQTIFKSDQDAKLTAAGYTSVKNALAAKGYYWNKSTEFHYMMVNTAWNAGSSTVDGVVYPTGWSVVFLSYFANGKIPPSMWVRDSLVDTPVGGGTVTIPAHYETVTPATVVEQSPNPGWNASAISAKSYAGDFVALFRIDSTNTGAVAGINRLENALKSSGYVDIPYGIKTAGNQYRIVESGVLKTAAATFSSNDKFTIRRIANTVIYTKNGVDIYTSATPMAGEKMVLDVSLYEAADAIYDASMTVASNALDPVLYPWSPGYGGGGGTETTTPDLIVDNENNPVFSPANSIIGRHSAIVVNALSAVCNAVVVNALQAVNLARIVRPLQTLNDLIVDNLEAIAVRNNLVIASTAEVVARNNLVINWPAFNEVVSRHKLLIESVDSLGSVVIDVNAPETPKYGAY